MSRQVGHGNSPLKLLPALGASALLVAPHAFGGGAAEPDHADPRLRVSAYSANEIYRLTGYVGYQIDVQFEPGESFVGLGAGDIESLGFAAEANHLFLKPKTASVDTNVTVLTTRRAYQFEYSASARRPDPALGDVTYALRFTYVPSAAASALERHFANAPAGRPHNLAYGYRGHPQLKPVSAWDDGVQTRLRFDARSELPALFVRGDDDSESLVNFTVENGELVVHRIARRFAVRRGGLHGCIVNEHFSGTGERLDSGTVAPDVERVTRGGTP